MGFFVCFSAIIHVSTKNFMNDNLIMASYFCSVQAFLLPLLVALFLSSWEIYLYSCHVPQVKSGLGISNELIVVSKLGFLFMGCKEHLCTTCKVSKSFSVF